LEINKIMSISNKTQFLLYLHFEWHQSLHSFEFKIMRKWRLEG